MVCLNPVRFRVCFLIGPGVKPAVLTLRSRTSGDPPGGTQTFHLPASSSVPGYRCSVCTEFSRREKGGAGRQKWKGAGGTFPCHCQEAMVVEVRSESCYGSSFVPGCFLPGWSFTSAPALSHDPVNRDCNSCGQLLQPTCPVAKPCNCSRQEALVLRCCMCHGVRH